MKQYRQTRATTIPTTTTDVSASVITTIVADIPTATSNAVAVIDTVSSATTAATAICRCYH